MNKIRKNTFTARAFGAFGLIVGAIFATTLLHPAPVQAAGLMSPVNSSNTALSIRSHKVNVMIENGYAVTAVDQVFSNPSGQDLEAIYRFPVPQKAAVSEFTVWIDEQPVTGEVFEKGVARQIYNEEKAAGRETGLAEKNKHYNFEIKVTPVRALQDTRIRLVYMQPLDIDTGIGRYVYPLESGGTDDVASAFWTAKTIVDEEFSFNLDLRSSVPVAGARVPSHSAAIVSQQNEQEWNIELSNVVAITHSNAIDIGALQPSMSNPAISLNKDIVVYWRLAEGLPASVDLVTHKPANSDRGTFMLTLSPGDDLSPITEGRDWVFVLDTSGSMNGKYGALIDGVKRALGRLQYQDRFRFVLFNDSARELTSNWVSATPENIAHWSGTLAQTGSGGGTNLYKGLKTGLNLIDSDRTSALVLVTDGEANVGVKEKKKFLKLMENNDVRLFTAVMGNGSNRPLLEAMTEVSNGFSVSVSNSDDIVGKLIEFASKASHQALHDLELKIDGVRTRDLTPKVTRTLYRGEQLNVFGHYVDGGEAVVTLSGKVSGEPRQYQTRFDFPALSNSNPEIERLWAFAKIEDLQAMSDYLGDDSEYRSAMVDIAVANGLVTDHTSMVVMREEQFVERGIKRLNRDRRLQESTAAEQRRTSPIQSPRVDQNQPAFSSPRASYSGGQGSGGGALGIELISLLSFLVLIFFNIRKDVQRPKVVQNWSVH